MRRGTAFLCGVTVGAVLLIGAYVITWLYADPDRQEIG